MIGSTIQQIPNIWQAQYLKVNTIISIITISDRCSSFLQLVTATQWNALSREISSIQRKIYFQFNQLIYDFQVGEGRRVGVVKLVQISSHLKLKFSLQRAFLQPFFPGQTSICRTSSTVHKFCYGHDLNFIFFVVSFKSLAPKR